MWRIMSHIDSGQMATTRRGALAAAQLGANSTIATATAVTPPTIFQFTHILMYSFQLGGLWRHLCHRWGVPQSLYAAGWSFAGSATIRARKR